MSRKAFLRISMITTVFLWAAQVWAAPLPADPRVAGNTASGWSYTDATGDGDSARTDVTLVTGSLDMSTNTLHFELTPSTGILQDPSGLYQYDGWTLFFDLNLDGISDASAGAYWNVDYFTWPATEWWDSTGLETGLAGPQIFDYVVGAPSLIIEAPITAAQANQIFHDGFQFSFTAGISGGSGPEDGVDSYVGLPAGLSQTWLYVVPEPGSLLLLGSGLGLLLPVLRRKAQK